ncbi:MAG: tatB [Devosia sp.]|uniref:Sec-independent protein translocase protein TatB n=1 Tax=Devosia sp. TaxID=1871048 RepID=UPI00261664BD|nr:Sec-independent protein translocase protein TatB [Devosia sp.]MDB5529291.1 tatB [Devosia sp.]
MLGLGWTEMLVIGVAALIFIGPKDLPVVMKRLGQLTGQIRRMGNEFQREINKTTGLDEVRNLRNAITQPLKQTTDQIRKDFNAMTATGEVKPSGLIKPADPKVESVVDEIRAQAGMTPPSPAPAPTPVKAAITPKAPAVKKAVAKAKAAPTSPVTTSDLKILEAVPAPAESQPIDMKPVVKKRTPKVAPGNTVPVLPTEPADSPAAPTPRARSPRKPKTSPAKAGTE